MSDNQSTSMWTPVFLYLMLAALLAITVALAGRVLLDWNALKVFQVFFLNKFCFETLEHVYEKYEIPLRERVTFFILLRVDLKKLKIRFLFLFLE